MIAIVDYGMGNVRCVAKALEYLGFEARLTADHRQITAASGVILPGVGAFGACMAGLERAGLSDVMMSTAASGKPLLGICVGMQMLFEESREGGVHRGLSLLPGAIERFPHGVITPHVGWNQVRSAGDCPLLRGIGEAAFYFVHSYRFPRTDAPFVAGVTEYDAAFASIVIKGNVMGTQFHPEKSGGAGLKLLANFAALTQGKG